jgi:Holliday junction resolvase
MSPERKIEAHLVKLAKKHGWFCRKVKWIGRNGCPDRLLISPAGLMIWVEVKAPGKEPTKLQQHEHRQLRTFHQLVYVIDDITQVEGVFA